MKYERRSAVVSLNCACIYITHAVCRGELSASAADRASSNDAVGSRLHGRDGADPARYSTLQRGDRAGGLGGAGEVVHGVGSGVDGLRQPPSGTSRFSVTDLHSSPSDRAVRTSSERTSSPPLPLPLAPPNHGSTATVLARYWPPPDGQSGRHVVTSEGACV